MSGSTVGNGITITNYSIDGSTLAFEPTTVGTTATYDLLVTNLVGVTQDVTISGVEAPFSLSRNRSDVRRSRSNGDLEL